MNVDFNAILAKLINELEGDSCQAKNNSSLPLLQSLDILHGFQSWALQHDPTVLENYSLSDWLLALTARDCGHSAVTILKSVPDEIEIDRVSLVMCHLFTQFFRREHYSILRQVETNERGLCIQFIAHGSCDHPIAANYLNDYFFKAEATVIAAVENRDTLHPLLLQLYKAEPIARAIRTLQAFIPGTLSLRYLTPAYYTYFVFDIVVPWQLTPTELRCNNAKKIDTRRIWFIPSDIERDIVDIVCNQVNFPLTTHQDTASFMSDISANPTLLRYVTCYNTEGSEILEADTTGLLKRNTRIHLSTTLCDCYGDYVRYPGTVMIDDETRLTAYWQAAGYPRLVPLQLTMVYLGKNSVANQLLATQLTRAAKQSKRVIDIQTFDEVLRAIAYLKRKKNLNVILVDTALASDFLTEARFELSVNSRFTPKIWYGRRMLAAEDEQQGFIGSIAICDATIVFEQLLALMV